VKRRRLALVERSAPDANAAALDAMAEALVPRILARLTTEQLAVEFVDVARFLDEDKQRAIAKPCRSGAIAGAVKVARRWKAPRAALLSWLEQRGPRAIAAKNDDEADELEDLRRRIAGERR
jgi:transposase-like protein